MPTYNEDLADSVNTADTDAGQLWMLLADAAATTTVVDGRLGVPLTDLMAWTTPAIGSVWPTLADAMVAGSSIDAITLANLVDRLVAAASLDVAAKLQGNAADSVKHSDAVLSAWNMLLTAGVNTVTDSASVQLLAVLVDTLVATGQVDGRLKALVACIEALALEDLIARGFTAQAVDAVQIADTAESIAALLGSLLDGLLVSDAGVPMLRLTCICAESLVMDDDGAAILRAKGDLADGVLVYATVRLGTSDYSGWVLNTDLRAATEYRTFPFDSLTAYRGKHYGAGNGGIVRFTGNAKTDTDAGVVVDAWLRTTLTDFGTDIFKRVPDAYIGCTADGDLILKTVTRDPGTGVKTEDWYAVTRKQELGPGVGRTEIGRGLKSTWWQFELRNVAGSSFALDTLRLRPLILDRRT